MSIVKVADGTEIYFKDWGKGQALFFHHGWPLSGDDWDAQMMFFVQKGFRVIAHDRRGHGRSSQVSEGHDMDTYAADVAAVVTALGLTNVVHIGHSTGGGEALHYAIKHGNGRVAKVVLISAVTPLMLQTPDNPGGVPINVFDEIRAGVAAGRAQFYYDFTIPFYGYNREGVTAQQGVRDNWWRQGMMGGIKAHVEGIKAFSETDFREDLKAADFPVLVLHGEDDQIVPFAVGGEQAIKYLKNGTLISYPGLPHGMPTTHADIINKDLLAFINS